MPDRNTEDQTQTGYAESTRAPEPEPIVVGDGPFGLTDAGDDDAEAKPGPSRGRKILLGGLLAATVAGASVLGYTGWRISSQKDATLATPARIASLVKDETDNGRQTADYLTTALSAEVGLDSTVGAVYTDPAATDKGVLFFGGTALIWSPDNDLETALDLVSDDQGAVTGVHDVPAGDLGGSMKCGTTTSDGSDLAVCGWADHGSLALAMFPNRPVAESAQLLLDIRSATQTRD